MPEAIRYMDAIREGIVEALRSDPRVILLGVDVGVGGGVFAVTRGLLEEFGPIRIRDTPISEQSFVGAAVGAAMTGLRPIVEVMFMDFLAVCLDPIINQAAKLRYMTGGALTIPLVVRTQTGNGRSAGAQHSQSLEGLVAHIPGLKVFCPGSVRDAYDLMLAATRDDNPVVYVENRRLYGLKGSLQEHEGLPPGKARIVRSGSRCTVVTWGRMIKEVIAATDGLDAELVDLRTLVPLDIETVLESVRKTGKLLVVTEAVSDFGPGAEIAALVAEHGFHDLDAPVRRLGGAPSPIPFSRSLEEVVVVTGAKIRAAVEDLLRA
jgi:pyruvate/2-oxoglutarate/acetoin dehydrogenase E1 component